MLEAFFVEDGAAMMVASMIDPPRMIHPSLSKISVCAANSFSPTLWASSRCRKWSSVVASGTCSQVKSNPMNLRIAYES